MASAHGITGRPSDQARFVARVALLISKVRTGDSFTRERAVLRLCALHSAGALTPEEAESFGQALWSQRDSDAGLPAGTGLLPHAFLALPGSDQEGIERLFRARIFDGNWSLNPEFLTVIVGATQIRSGGTRLFELTSDEALRLFDKVENWQPRTTLIDLERYNFKMKRLVGAAIADAILPFVDLNSLGRERLERLFSMVEAGTVSSAVVSLPEAVRLDRSSENKAIKLIQRSALGLDTETAIHGLQAIGRWRRLSKAGVIGKVPQQLIQAVMTTVVGARGPGLYVALDIASKFVGDGDLGEDNKCELTDALDRLRAETEYSSWDVRDPRTVTLTLVRAHCVRLADKLGGAGMSHDAIAYWVDAAKDDPVPEVRYALDEAEEER
jgi:hypothetical protein